MIAILFVLVAAASATSVTSVAEDPVKAACNLFPTERRSGIQELLDCVYGGNTTAKHEAAAEIFFRKPEPSFIQLAETAESDEWRKCLVQSNDSYLVALGHVGGENVKLSLDKKETCADYQPADVLDAYHAICKTTPRFPLPSPLAQGTVSRSVDDRIRRHYRLLELYGALSFLGEKFNPGRFCGFDLADRLDKTVFTNDWKEGDRIIAKWFENDAENLIFLVNAVML